MTAIHDERAGAGERTPKIIDELCVLFHAVLRSTRLAGGRTSPPSPAEIVALLLGVSTSLMVGGSVTFVIGFVMMPWVVGMLLFMYFVGLVSNISGLGRGVFFAASDDHSRDNFLMKRVQGALFSKVPTGKRIQGT